MTLHAWLTLAIVFATVVMLVRDTVAPSIAVLGAVIVLLTVGVVTPAQAFSGFSNPAPITVAALYVVARSVEKTGALQPIVQGMLGAGHGMRTSLGRLLVPTAGASAFLNNTPIVAMLIPQVTEWAERRGKPASWYLLPLSFAAILGGTITVIGTSTNLVVSGLLEASGEPPLGMFEMTRVGLPIAIVGLVALVLLAPRLLPDRRPARTGFTEEMREFVVRMQVDGNGAMTGRSVEEAGLRHLKGVFLAEIERGERVIAPVAPAERLEHGDHLTFVGRADDVLDLQAMRGLSPAAAKQASGLDGPEHTFFETVVSAASPLVGKTLKEIDFRNRYQAAVYAIHRAGHRVKAKLGDVQMRPGDTLLLLADDGFRDRWRDRSDFLLVSKLGGSPPVGSRKAWIVGAITLGIVLLAGLGMIPILQAALLGAIALVLLRVLSPQEARSAVDLDVVVLIAAAFGLGAAMEASGLAAVLAAGIVSGFEVFGPVGVLLAVVVATALFTELVTNNAAAVLMFPIAMGTAAATGLDPRGVAIAVAIAASAAFLSPIGYQTNTMVYGPGGYRFGDYARVGGVLSLIVAAGLAVLVPLHWPA